MSVRVAVGVHHFLQDEIIQGHDDGAGCGGVLGGELVVVKWRV